MLHIICILFKKLFQFSHFVLELFVKERLVIIVKNIEIEKAGNRKMRLDQTGLTCGFFAHFSSKSFLALSRKSWTENKIKGVH